MTDDLLAYADRLLSGAEQPEGHWASPQFWGQLAPVGDRTAFVAAFANVAALDTDDGLVLVDTSSEMTCDQVHQAVKGWSGSTLHTAVFTHGHVDHCFGVDRYEAEARDRGATAPRVVAHELITDRFDRYRQTRGYNGIINQRQFRLEKPYWPESYRYPDETFRTRLDIEVGGEPFELHHARGETDDHVWVWAPERRVLCTGDLIIWASPNCGNPQKVQRYAIEWAAALRAMAALGGEVLLPGHGLPIVGAARVEAALEDTATMLEHLHNETIAMMNQGARLDEIVHTVRAPADLLEKPYLRPVYDEPEFVVRNVWRLFGGWYDGNPANLKPAPDAVLANELATLAGGPDRLAARARELVDEGDLRLAGHLAEMAALAAPEDTAIHAVRAEVFERRVAAEASTMAKGVFSWAARESRTVTGEGADRN
jgi:alkyl sulfatase BDS1-like metallo-beta-lactamase superfamily hydrolase